MRGAVSRMPDQGKALHRLHSAAGQHRGKPFAARTGSEGFETHMSWTDERIEKLTKMWEGGATASQIAEELGGVSRNAVIGKAHRLGLKARPSPVKPNDKTEAAAPKSPRPAPEAPPPEPRAAAPRPARSRRQARRPSPRRARPPLPSKPHLLLLPRPRRTHLRRRPSRASSQSAPVASCVRGPAISRPPSPLPRRAASCPHGPARKWPTRPACSI